MGARHERRTDGGTPLRTLVIGRSPSADVVIADTSVAPHHAELVITADGRLYLTDCATDGGTWIKSEGERRTRAGSRSVRASCSPTSRCGWATTSARPATCCVGAAARRRMRSAGGGAWEGAGQRRMRGPVARDPTTGEIVRRRP